MTANTPHVKKLMEVGVTVTKASFIQAVDTIYDIPEKRLDLLSTVNSRRAEMYYTPMGLLCIQLDEAFLVPLANIISAK